MLPAVPGGTLARVADPSERRRRVVGSDGELGKRHEVRPVVAAGSRKGAQAVSDAAVHGLDPAGGAAAMRRAEGRRRAEGLARAGRPRRRP